jgi:rSAM/selenodomain-associated transferase 1
MEIKSSAMEVKRSNDLLIIFMKAPVNGTFKTRLQPQLSQKLILKLYKAMGMDLIRNLSQASKFDLHIYYWPKEKHLEMKKWLGADIQYFPQKGLDLGARLFDAFAASFSLGYKKVCIIGSDLPTLTEEIVRESFEYLVSFNLVIGPSQDGGYYLIALKKMYPILFEGINWSTDKVLMQTLNNASKIGLSVKRMKPENDIDSFEDLAKFYQQVKIYPDLKIPFTKEVLNHIFVKSGNR